MIGADSRPGDLLLVVSGFGMEASGLSSGRLERLIGDEDQFGTHEPAPDGFLLAYGTNVAPGEYRRGSIVDLAPTVLYYMGVPVGRDMDGFARTDLFSSSFTRERPVQLHRDARGRALRTLRPPRAGCTRAPSGCS